MTQRTSHNWLNVINAKDKLVALFKRKQVIKPGFFAASSPSVVDFVWYHFTAIYVLMLRHTAQNAIKLNKSLQISGLSDYVDLSYNTSSFHAWTHFYLLCLRLLISCSHQNI